MEQVVHINNLIKSAASLSILSLATPAFAKGGSNCPADGSWAQGLSWWESFLFNIWWVVEGFFTSFLPFLIGACICIAIVVAVGYLIRGVGKWMSKPSWGFLDPYE